MSSLLTAAKQAEFGRLRKNWDRIYIFVDLHSTAILPDYKDKSQPIQMYPYAEDTLRLLTKRKDIILVMYTCSSLKTIDKYITEFAALNITFDYINENPEVTTSSSPYGNYDKKPYFNLLLDDKCGFEPDIDWLTLLNFYSY